MLLRLITFNNVHVPYGAFFMEIIFTCILKQFTFIVEARIDIRIV